MIALKIKYVFPFLLLLAIALRWEHELFNPKFWSDEMAQYIAAKSLMENHGPTLPVAMASDYSSTIYLPLKQFPEGYSYMIAAVWYITNSLYVAVVFWQWIGIVAYILAWLLIFKYFENQLDGKAIVPFLLITAFSLSPWLYYKPTDLLAVSFYWLGLAIFILGQQKKLTISISMAGTAGLLFLLTTTLRYAYQPIMPLTIFSLVVVGFISKDKKMIYTSSFMAISFGLFWGLYNQFLKVKGNLPSEAQSKNFYWENLLQVDLSIFNKPFFDDRIIHSLLFKLGGENIVNFAKTCISIAILGLLAFFLIKRFTTKGPHPHKTLLLLIVPGWIAALASIGLLFMLSALSKPQENDYLHVWTYVRETRYYAPVFVICLFSLMFVLYEKNRPNSWVRYAKFGVGAMIVVSSIPYYLVAKYSTIMGDPQYFSLGETKIMYGESNADVLPTLKKTILENTFGQTKPVYFAANRTVRYAQLSGSSLPFPDFSGLENAKTSQKVAILIHFGKNDPYNNLEIKNFANMHSLDTIYKSPTDTLLRFVLYPEK